jgi:hypothetical protein
MCHTISTSRSRSISEQAIWQTPLLQQLRVAAAMRLLVLLLLAAVGWTPQLCLMLQMLLLSHGRSVSRRIWQL